MHLAFRGRTLDIGNYNGDSIDEIALLIGNKKAEDFMLQKDKQYNPSIIIPLKVSAKIYFR